MKSSDYYWKRYVQDLRKITLPPDLFQELNYFMESHSTPLSVLPQFNLVENATKNIQNKLYTDKLDQDWTCCQQFVKLLAPMRFYKSKSQYFPTQNIPPLDTDALQLDISSRGKYSVPIKNMEIWEKKVSSLVAINSHADLF